LNNLILALDEESLILTSLMPRANPPAVRAKRQVLNYATYPKMTRSSNNYNGNPVCKGRSLRLCRLLAYAMLT